MKFLPFVRRRFPSKPNPADVRPKLTPDDNCKIVVKRDNSGNPKQIEFSGKCSKNEIEIAKQHLNLDIPPQD